MCVGWYAKRRIAAREKKEGLQDGCGTSDVMIGGSGNDEDVKIFTQSEQDGQDKKLIHYMDVTEARLRWFGGVQKIDLPGRS